MPVLKKKNGLFELITCNELDFLRLEICSRSLGESLWCGIRVGFSFYNLQGQTAFHKKRLLCVILYVALPHLFL